MWAKSKNVVASVKKIISCFMGLLTYYRQNQLQKSNFLHLWYQEIICRLFQKNSLCVFFKCINF